MAIINRKKNALSESLINSIEELSLFLKDKKLNTIPLDIEKVLTNMNIKLRKEENLDNDISGYITTEHSEWIIGVNSNHHPNRQRFTIAHELGHYILHSHLIKKNGRMEDTKLFRNGAINNAEIAANQIAGQLLMPENKFRNYITRGVTSIDELANKFEVSSLAVRYRAKELGYKGHGV